MTTIDDSAVVRAQAQQQQLRARITALKAGRDQVTTPTLAVAWPWIRALFFVALYFVRKELGAEDDES